MKTSFEATIEMTKGLSETIMAHQFSNVSHSTEQWAFILYYLDGTIDVNGGSFTLDGSFMIAEIEFPTVKALRAVVQNTWLDNRDVQPEEPTSAIIKLNVATPKAIVTYCTSDDAEDWVVTNENFTEIFESLTP